MNPTIELISFKYLASNFHKPLDDYKDNKLFKGSCEFVVDFTRVINSFVGFIILRFFLQCSPRSK